MKNQRTIFRKAQSIVLFLSLLLSISFHAHSQEFNAGLNLGYLPCQGSNYYSVGGNVEFKPKHAYFSINTDPFVLFDKTYATFTEPIYLKFIIGKKLRVCPSAGGFVRTSGNNGWLLGLHVEYLIKQKFILFSKNELYADHWKDTWPDHFGGSSVYINQGRSLLFSVGVKMMLKK
ncbi:MAG: hypothetical protein RL207_1336 [Bacteroidota bacterium]|jgi:hypothetical protein